MHIPFEDTETIERLKTYFELANDLKRMKKEQELLKIDIMRDLDTDMIQAGGYFATVTDCSRSSIDKEKLTLEFGSKFIAEHTKVTEYQTLKVQKIA